jgi:hypothetical protein
MELEKVLKLINNKLDSLTILITTGVDTMENYKYILGQINALEATKQEISNLLNEKEQNEGTVVDIKTKNTLT